MLSTLKKFLTMLFAFSLFFLVSSFQNVAHADCTNKFSIGNVHKIGNDGSVTCESVNKDTAETGTKTAASYILKTAKSLMWLSVGLGSIVIVYAGFSYATSMGDVKKLESAKSLIMYAAIGMIVSFGSLTILNLIKETTGIDF